MLTKEFMTHIAKAITKDELLSNLSDFVITTFAGYIRKPIHYPNQIRYPFQKGGGFIELFVDDRGISINFQMNPDKLDTRFPLSLTEKFGTDENEIKQYLFMLLQIYKKESKIDKPGLIYSYPKGSYYNYTGKDSVDGGYIFTVFGPNGEKLNTHTFPNKEDSKELDNMIEG